MERIPHREVLMVKEGRRPIQVIQGLIPIRIRSNNRFYDRKGMKPASKELIAYMQEKKLSLALAESITCGLAAAKLSSCIGVSDVLQASVVCYTPDAKAQLLGVRQQTMDRFTCESAEVTAEMAAGLAEKSKADVYAALTGLASKGGTESKDKPVGTVFYAMRYAGKLYETRKLFRGSPLEIKEKACKELYTWILGQLQQN